MRHTAKNLIGGQWIGAASGRAAHSVDPASGMVFGEFPDGGREDAENAIAWARRAFEQQMWSQSPRVRQAVMLEWAAGIEARKEELALLLTRESGKVLAQAQAEIVNCASAIRYYAGLARDISGRVVESEPGMISTMLREAAGVAGIIIPWNAPAILLIRTLAPALAAGCTTVIKPAPQAAQITYAVIAALHGLAGLPDGVVNLFNETSTSGAELLARSDEIDVLCFIGSTRTATKIIEASAPSVKRLSLELGGSAACVVCEDADVGSVARRLAAAAMVISGQHCTAARRIMVHASRYEAFANALKAELEGMAVGPGDRPGSQIGPLVDAAAFASVTERIAQATDDCDRVLLCGHQVDAGTGGGYFLSPTLVAQQSTDIPFMQEEIFGPFVTVTSFETEADVIRYANHTPYGLSASVWTQDGNRAMRLSRALRAGTVWINDHNRLFVEAETGGYRKSGLGRLNGREGLADFLETKHIFHNFGTIAQSVA